MPFTDQDPDAEQRRLDATAAYAAIFADAAGRLRRENPAALEAALSGIPEAHVRAPARRPSKDLLDFKRDLLGENVLIGKRWGVRGTVVMVVSSTGTGKSVAQTQMAVSFANGLPCCGLRPMRPFRSWIIQSEDDEDRIAIDRDDIFAEMAELNARSGQPLPRGMVTFKDFTSFTGAKFLDELDKELFLAPDEEKPAAIFINPMNAYFGGTLKEGSDCSAFFKGGMLQGRETDGLEALAKRYNVLVIIFGHTPKPPTKSELKEWVDDPNICYKMCGASEIADAVRSILVFLRDPDNDGLFVFNAGKNGYTLGWTDAADLPTTKSYWRWAASGRHFWEEVPKGEWPGADKAATERAALDADVAALLSRMVHPGIGARDISALSKEMGLSRGRLRSAFYEIRNNRMKYNVVSNVMPNPHGPATTLYHVAGAFPSAAPAPASAPAQDDLDDLDLLP